MADAVWPAELPQAPQTNSLSMTWPNVVRRTAMDAGPPKARRFISHAPDYVTVELKLTRNQVAVLREFIYDTIAGGALPFEWKDHRTGDECEYRFVDVAQARPRASRLADGSELWVVAFQLELMPQITTQALTVNNRPPPFRTNFTSGFGGAFGGVVDFAYELEPVDGAFNHDWVPGSTDQGAPGGPITLPCAGGGSHDGGGSVNYASSSTSSTGMAGGGLCG